ncbi:hypothetical protein AVEN_135816-1, partial [Araneus ventricosus]
FKDEEFAFSQILKHLVIGDEEDKAVPCLGQNDADLSPITTTYCSVTTLVTENYPKLPSLPGVPGTSNTSSKPTDDSFNEALNQLSPVPIAVDKQIKENSQRKSHSYILAGTPVKNLFEESEAKRAEKAIKKEGLTAKKAASKLLEATGSATEVTKMKRVGKKRKIKK